MNKGEAALKLRADGMSNKAIAELFGMKVDSVRRLISETRTGQPEMASEIRAKPTIYIIPDTQVKPGVETKHLSWIGKDIAHRKPDIVVHLGDHADMASLSSYEGRGSKYFEGKRYKADVDSANDGWRLIEDGMGDFQPKRKIYLLGNHEDRITRAVNTDPRLEGVIGFHDFIDEELGWERIPFLQPLILCGIMFSHYFPQPLSGRPYSGAIENQIKNIGGSFVQGHRQGLFWGRRELANGQAQTGLVAGSAYLHHEDYLTPQGNNHWRGTVVLFEAHEGDYDILTMRMSYLEKEHAA